MTAAELGENLESELCDTDPDCAVLPCCVATLASDAKKLNHSEHTYITNVIDDSVKINLTKHGSFCRLTSRRPYR